MTKIYVLVGTPCTKDEKINLLITQDLDLIIEEAIKNRNDECPIDDQHVEVWENNDYVNKHIIGDKSSYHLLREFLD